MDKISSIPDAMGHFEQILEESFLEAKKLSGREKSFFDTPAGKVIALEAMAEFSRGKATLDFLAKGLSSYSLVGEKYAPFFEERSACLAHCVDLLKEGAFWDAARFLEEGFSASMPRISKCPPEEAEIKTAFAEVHNRLKKELISFCKEHFEKTEEEMRTEWEEALFLTKEFYLLCAKAEEKFNLAKREKKILDYADLENMALLLVAEKKNGTWQKTAIGEEITEELGAVFVDEYQDSNRIQDLIFRSITRKDNLFIVGDPKQSIYRFRGAEPSIFSEYKNSLPLYPAPEGEMQKIFLSHNFRCAEPIIDLVNRIFAVMMDETARDSLYKKEDALVFSKEKAPSECTELVLMEKILEEDAERAFDEEILIRDENREAGYLADRIAKILSGKEGKQYQPEEIAVICRTHRQIALVREALAARKIPCGDAPDAVFKEKSEYLFVSSLLSSGRLSLSEDSSDEVSQSEVSISIAAVSFSVSGVVFEGFPVLQEEIAGMHTRTASRYIRTFFIIFSFI